MCLFLRMFQISSRSSIIMPTLLHQEAPKWLWTLPNQILWTGFCAFSLNWLSIIKSNVVCAGRCCCSMGGILTAPIQLCSLTCYCAQSGTTVVKLWRYNMRTMLSETRKSWRTVETSSNNSLYTVLIFMLVYICPRSLTIVCVYVCEVQRFWTLQRDLALEDLKYRITEIRLTALRS